MINSFDDLYTLMVEETSKEYISDYGRLLNDLLRKKETKEKIELQIKNNHYSSLAIVDLFLPVLQQAKSLNKQQWLELIYDFTLGLSFPEKSKENVDSSLEPLIYFYLEILRIFCQLHIEKDKESFIHRYSPSLLSKEEAENSLPEYHSFLQAYSDLYIYELMYMDMDLTGHNTLEHLVGVNHLAMFISRQLRNLGLPLDLGMVAASSLAHDIGKYGVLDRDQKKVPYYHYYYSEEWYSKNQMPNIGHLASNHSTWDLELENLPLESLVLIYCDFRVKNRVESGTYSMDIFSLDQSYHIILGKLDNLDQAKEERYEKVYKKLKDFEDYMHFLGVNTNPHTYLNPFRETYHEIFMDSQEIIDSFKFLAIENNIHLMAKLIDENEFNTILDLVRSEYNWRRLRVYLQIFSEYATYLTKKQKTLLINFLLDLLFHKEEDIRKEAALLIGVLVSKYDEDSRKELPASLILNVDEDSSAKLLKEILDKILYPDYKYSNSNIDWQYNLKNLIKSLFIHSTNDKGLTYVEILLGYYHSSVNMDFKAQLYLAQTLKYLPYALLDQAQLDKIYSYMNSLVLSPSLEIRLTLLDLVDEIYENDLKGPDFDPLLQDWLDSKLKKTSIQVESYMVDKLSAKLNINRVVRKSKKLDQDLDLSNIFLDNLKTATDWMNKKINIDLLYDQVLKNPRELGLHTGMHFCNLLKVSAVEKVRNYAGHTLINIFPYLAREQQNDIVVELLRALEMQNYQFTKYIPKYLGQAILYLKKSELDEIIDDLEIKIKTSNIQTSFLILQLVGYSIEYIDDYKEKDKIIFENTLNRLVGILLIGMASYKEDIQMEAFRILSTSIFKSRRLALEDKYYIFNLIAKKILVLLPKNSREDFFLLNSASSFNNLYRFIVDYELEYGKVSLDMKTKYAFFPGSFDPFTNGHREIVRTIRDLGFEVYLAIDEFSWSKRTQAHNFRRDIINMSLANERDVFIFPGDLTINISNNLDLDKLELLFPASPYIVIGVDVLLNASAYKKDNKICSFPHIIIDREDDKGNFLEEKLSLLEGETLFLNIHRDFRDISSTKIRNRIDLERDVSDKIDPLAEGYIYEHGLYLKEAEYKTSIQSKTIEYKVYSKKDLCPSLTKELILFLKEDLDLVQEILRKNHSQLLILRKTRTKEILGVSCFYKLNNNFYFDDFKDSSTTEYLRQTIKGSSIFFPYIYSPRNFNTLLNESLLHAIKNGFNYCLVRLGGREDRDFIGTSLISHGFLELEGRKGLDYLVDMSNPITFSENLEIFLKPPFDKDPRIKSSIETSRLKVRKAITDIFPGQLILSISKDMLYSKMIDKICHLNGVESYQMPNPTLGDKLCVPFGNILNDNIIPNTVTKTLHTEKVFSKDLKNFSIRHFPNYLPLAQQVKVLKSFNRPVILVDDILHKGHRLESIKPYILAERLDLNSIIVGILSGRGLELAKETNIKVDAAYFIPNLNIWFNESSLVPFLGGDMVDRGQENQILLASINFILPYANPSFIRGRRDKVVSFSQAVLESSIELFQQLEKVYQEEYLKNLLIRNLGEVLTIPRKPDLYNISDYSASSKPSEYLVEDLNKLMRIY